MRTKSVLLVMLAACSVGPSADTVDTPQMLEATLHYDAAASPPLSIVSLVRRPGPAPALPPVTDGYVADVLVGHGEVLSSLTFELPLVAEDPPPQEGDLSASGALHTTAELAVTLPWSADAVALRPRDPMAGDLDERTLTGVALDVDRLAATTFRGADPAFHERAPWPLGELLLDRAGQRRPARNA